MAAAQHSSPLFPLARIWAWRSNAVASVAKGNAESEAESSQAGTKLNPASTPRHIPSLLSSVPHLNSIPEAGSTSTGTSRSKSPETTPPSPRPSPLRVLASLKPECIIDCSSGDVPKTHSVIVDAGAQCKQSAVVVHHDAFFCQDAVNTTRLLILSRKRVLEKIFTVGGNTIVDERWSCIVHKHESKREKRYKVIIVYRGIPARSNLPDPDQPISLHEVKSIPGLMTILSRQSKYESSFSSIS